MKPPQIQPYLFFEGACEEALEFYRQTVGAEILTRMRFQDSPVPTDCGPIPGDKIMHASFRIGGSIVLASDGRCSGAAGFKGFALSLTVGTLAEADQLFAALGVGGQIQMPMGETFFSPGFGMLTDRFGVSWMVYVVPPTDA